MAILSFPRRLSIPFVRHRFLPLGLLMAMVFAVALGFLTRGLNWGVDFRGGLLIEAQMPYAETPKDLNILRKQLHKTFLRDFSLQELGKSGTKTGQTILIRTEQVADSASLLERMKSFLGEKATYRRVESIGPKMGNELITHGIQAVLWALLGIMLYVWIRFEWQFSVCAFVALIHDCLGLLVFFLFSGIEFNEGAIVALLITAAYSINDTVVIFDRLRENLQKEHLSHASHSKSKQLAALLNQSLNETLSRTALTSSTTLLALAMLYIFGGEVISAFSLPILVGILIGTYSSIIIAVPLLLWLPSLIKSNSVPQVA